MALQSKVSHVLAFTEGSLFQKDHMNMTNTILDTEQPTLDNAVKEEEKLTTQSQPAADKAPLQPRPASSEARPLSAQSFKADAPTFVPHQQNGQLGAEQLSRNNVFPYAGGPQSVHRAQHSDSSLIFGSLPNSHHTSPAPQQYPFPPPPPPQQVIQPLSNGYVLPPPGFGYAQGANSHGAPSPRPDLAHRGSLSFGVSPSITPAFDNPRQHIDSSTPVTFPGHTPPPHGMMNGHMRSDSAGTHPSRRASLAPGMVGGQGHDDLDGLAAYVQSLFGEHIFADTILHVRFANVNGRAVAPFACPGHGILLARSPVLKQLLLKQAASDNGKMLPREIYLDADDRYIRGDSLWHALQRLYGRPLLSTETMPDPASPHATNPGASLEADKFDLALGYVVSGNMLQIPPVIHRGIDVACQLVSWQTLEKALEFGLSGGLHPEWTNGQFYENAGPPTYGPHANMLVHTAMNFIIANFPSHFEFDHNAAEPKHNRRLPLFVETRRHNPKLSSIKFGELPAEVTDTTPHDSTSAHAILSRIFVNLPFPLLKFALESQGLGAASNGAPSGLRSHVMHEVVNEREKRRTRVKEDIKVSNEERAANLQLWQTVGFQETVKIDPLRKVPVLNRTWVDFKLPE